MEVRGADDIDDLVRNVRAHADRSALQRELSRGLNSASKGVRGRMIEVIPSALPRRGGLAAQVKAKARSRAVAKSGRYAGVSIRFQARGMDLRTLTGKRLRHPVFGNRSTWVEQTAGVDPAVFMSTFEEQAPEVQAEMLRVFNEVARKVTD